MNETTTRIDVSQRGRVLAAVEATSIAPIVDGTVETELDASAGIELRIDRTSWARTEARVRVGGEVVFVVPPGRERMTGPTDVLRDEFGETEIVVEEREPGAAWPSEPLIRLGAVVRGRPEIEELYERLVADLEAVHVGLAEDLVARTSHRRGGRRTAGVVRPEDDVRRLAELATQLSAALDRIGTQPSGALVREARRSRYRAGDRVRPAAVGAALRDRETWVVGRRVRSIGRVEVLRTRPTTDIAEHRHLREGLLRLAARARAVVEHCARSAGLYERERRRWGRARDTESSVFERRYRPKLDALREFRVRAEALEGRFRALVDDNPFLAGAGPARTRLAPTPIFRNRPGYREAYSALVEASALTGSSVDGDGIRVRYRSLSTLYEYWCFVRVVGLLREHPDIGAAAADGSFRLVDDVYRPELEPGQSVRLPIVRGRGIGGLVRVTYEPDIVPEGWAPGVVATADDDRRGALATARAALSDAPLRPDIVVEVVRRSGESSILVLDAKSTATFDRDRLFSTTDYRGRIYDPATGDQPVRQVFLLHRDVSAAPVTNLPGYLERTAGSIRSSILGATPFLPDRVESGRRVLERFVSLAVESPAAKPPSPAA